MIASSRSQRPSMMWWPAGATMVLCGPDQKTLRRNSVITWLGLGLGLGIGLGLGLGLGVGVGVGVGIGVG